VETSDELFNGSYDKGQVIRIPIAHHDGNYFVDSDILKSIEDNGHVAYRYCDKDGNVSTDANPNGSLNNIAGIFNGAGNVLGMMPHPERLADPQLGGTDGKPLFDGLIAQLS
jgi:phosphoribosylformylglycinamidine synthase